MGCNYGCRLFKTCAWDWSGEEHLNANSNSDKSLIILNGNTWKDTLAFYY